jgi:CRISPR/Cas system-associated exonuclease Cas4 (RecB family)
MCYTLAMQVIRSSDIGNYLYCRRAWWYRRQGFESENQAELASGTELHRKHGRKVLAAGLMRGLGFLLLLLALILLVAYCTMQLL